MKAKITYPKLPYTGLQIAMEVVAGMLMLLILVMTALLYADAPQQLPTHFDINGQPDAWGGRGVALTMPLAALLMYALLTLCQMFPQTWNMPFKERAAADPAAFGTLKTTLIVLKAVVVLLLGYLGYCTLSARPLLPWAMWGIMALLFITLIGGVAAVYLRLRGGGVH